MVIDDVAPSNKTISGGYINGWSKSLMGSLIAGQLSADIRNNIIAIVYKTTKSL